MFAEQVAIFMTAILMIVLGVYRLNQKTIDTVVKKDMEVAAV